MEQKSKPKQQPSLRDYFNGYGQWCYLKAKIGWAAWLGRHSAGMSKAKLKAILSSILIFWVGYCSFLVIGGFSGLKGTDVHITPIKTVIPANKGPATARVRISRPDYQRIKAFHNYMDSLRGDADGKKVYDSLMKARPGLMDSITLTESYYESNVKQ